MRDPGAALIVIDVQRGFDDPVWGDRDNPACEANIGALIEHWRALDRPIVFVRHDSDEPGSSLAPGQPATEIVIVFVWPSTITPRQLGSARVPVAFVPM